jgi:sugar lactone lactonase YvrE
MASRSFTVDAPSRTDLVTERTFLMRCLAIAALSVLMIAAGARAAEEPIFEPGAKLKVEAGDGAGGEGPAWHPQLGLLASGNGHIYQLDRAGKSRIYRQAAGTNGLLFDQKGRLLACEPERRRITRTEIDGAITVLTDRYQGQRYNEPNDLTLDSQGRIYFSDPRYGASAGKDLLDDKGRTIEGVYRIDPDGQVMRVIGREVERANGVLVSADDRALFVADNNNNTIDGARKLWRFDLRKDGSVDPESKKLLYDWGKGRGPDGVKQDQLGRLYVAAGLNKPNPPFEPAEDVKGGIYVFSPEGKRLAFLPVPRDEVTNCAFGGEDRRTLYITAGGTLYSIRTRAPGRLVWPAAKEAALLSPEQASVFARLALKGIQKEYPNKPDHVLNQETDIKGPRALHPAFYGCFDWHSAVHSHWLLVRLLRRFPELPERKEIRVALAEHLTAKNLQAEADYFAQPNRLAFERTYGWAWLLKLAEELHGWDDPDAREWSRNLRPLADVIVARYVAFLPKQTYAIRSGVHPNTAFGLAFALDYALAVGHTPLRERVEERSRTYFAQDVSIPAAWEPNGADFFSPSLMEADLMRRVLTPVEFTAWFHRFLPDLAKGEPKTLLEPAKVTDRSDPQLVHLDGLNLSRAWCLRSIAAALPKDDPVRTMLAESATRHAEAALRHVASGEYVGEHWLATFAVYLLSMPAPE